MRSRPDGVCFDRSDPAHERYVPAPPPHSHEIWTLRHQTRHIPRGKNLRLVLPAAATCRWTFSNWATQTDHVASESGLRGLWPVDLPTAELGADTIVEWTLHWEVSPPRWEGRYFQIRIA